MTALGYNAMYFADDKGTLTAAGENSVATGLSVLLDAVTANNYEKGWRPRPDQPMGHTTRNMGELIALLHSEVSEAFEAYRNNEPVLWFEHNVKVNGETQISGPGSGFADQSYLTDTDTGEAVLGKPQGIASELADVLIRLVDMAQEHDIPLISATISKHEFNQTRAFRHGGKAC